MKNEILDLLETNGTLEPEKIATMLDIPVSKVEKKVNELEEKNIIVKYQALIDWDKTDKELVSAFIDVEMVPEREVGFDEVAKRIYGFPEVSSAYLISGGYDLAVEVKGRTMKEVALFVAEKLASIKHVQSTTTHFRLKTYKKDGVVFKTNDNSDQRLVVSP